MLADVLTRTCGLDWERRDRGVNRSPAFELAGVGVDLVAEFSSRSRAIEVEKDRLIEDYVLNHGRPPRTETIIKLRAQATRATRPPKEIHSLAELTAGWRARAARALGQDATSWARAVLARGARGDFRRLARGLLRADDVSPVAVTKVARATVGAVSQKRSTWRHWNLWAEASRQTMEWRFATIEDRERAVGAIVEEAERISIALTPPELAHSPGVFRRSDGTSMFRPQHSVTFTSEEILAAEDRLLARADHRGAPTVDLDLIEGVSRREVLGHLLSEEQVGTLATIAASGRQVDLLIGPAGRARQQRCVLCTRPGRASTAKTASSGSPHQQRPPMYSPRISRSTAWVRTWALNIVKPACQGHRSRGGPAARRVAVATPVPMVLTAASMWPGEADSTVAAARSPAPSRVRMPVRRWRVSGWKERIPSPSSASWRANTSGNVARSMCTSEGGTSADQVRSGADPKQYTG